MTTLQITLLISIVVLNLVCFYLALPKTATRKTNWITAGYLFTLGLLIQILIQKF